MGKYNLLGLDPLEFEQIAAEILSIKKGSKFRTFKAGKDGGIDALELKTREKIIVQSKRYNNFSSLYQVLKKEKEKLKSKSEIEEYYIFTSYSLNPGELKKVFTLFAEYMNGYENIYDGEMISDFLDDPQNFNILRKHPCLWLSNSSMLEYLASKNILIDSDVLLKTIEDNDKYYVDNSFYKKCIEEISQNNCLLILGAAGAGKSTISSKIILYLLQTYKSQNIQLRYTSDYEYTDLKKSIEMSPNVFEVIYLDDIVGKVCLAINERDTRGLISLIKYIRLHKNKFLIMNSRIAILNNKYERDSEFKNCILENNISLVEIGEYSDIEKARIFFKRLKNDVPLEYNKEILKDRRYWQIIKHPNYNPRLIEIICKPKLFEDIKPEKYYSYVLNILKNPKDIWKEEYRKLLEREDIILLDTIFSLADKGMVDINFVKEAFYHVIKKERIKEKGDNLFDNSIERLSNSYLNLFFDEVFKKRYVSFINNSLFDYYNEMVEGSPAYKQSLLEDAIYGDQLVKITKWDIKEKCKDLSVYSYINDDLSNDFIQYSKVLLQILKIRDTYDWRNIDTYQELSSILLCEQTAFHNKNYYVDLFLKDFFSDVNKTYLMSFFVEKFKAELLTFNFFCSNVSYGVVDKVLNLWEDIDELSYNDNFEYINEIVSSCYENDFTDLLDEVIADKINDAISNSEYRYKDYWEPAREEDVKNELIDLVLNDIGFKCDIFFDSRLNPEFDKGDVEYAVDSFDLAEEITNYYYEPDYKTDLEDKAYELDGDIAERIDYMYSFLLEE